MRTSSADYSGTSSRPELHLPVFLFHLWSVSSAEAWIGELIGEMRKTTRHSASISSHSKACQSFIPVDKVISTFYSSVAVLLLVIMCCGTRAILTTLQCQMTHCFQSHRRKHKAADTLGIQYVPTPLYAARVEKCQEELPGIGKGQMTVSLVCGL